MSVGIKQAERAPAALSRSHPSHRSRGFTLLHLMIAIAAVGMTLSASVSIFGAEAPVRQASPSPGHKRIAQKQAEPRGGDMRGGDARSSDARSSDARGNDARGTDTSSADTRSTDARDTGAREAPPQGEPMGLRAAAPAEQTTR